MTGVPKEAEAFAALNAGVRGYCHVGAASQQLLEIALVVENGGLWMPTAIDAASPRGVDPGGAPRLRLTGLSAQ